MEINTANVLEYYQMIKIEGVPMLPSLLFGGLKLFAKAGPTILKSVAALGLTKILFNKAATAPASKALLALIAAKLASNKGKTFRTVLLEYIDKSGHSDPDIYKRAGCSRQLFYKIKNVKSYHASKDLVMAFCLALELNAEDAIVLLKSAGYALSNGDNRDIVFAFCIDNKVYDLMTVNVLLDEEGLEPIGYQK